jgi:uncharacterized protein
MDITVENKARQLIDHIKQFRNLAVAFSGGVDSTYLLDIAVESLQDKVIAVTAQSPIHSIHEQETAARIASHLGVRHYFVQTHPLSLDDFVANTPARCYFCKTHLFSALWAKSRELGFTVLAHGANLDDTNDYRPGFKAATELSVKAPLMDVGMTKADIRILSQKRGLSTWNKPAMACLATRIPYSRKITLKRLKKIDAAEEILIDLGFLGCRVRWHQEIARIEVPLEMLPKLVDPKIRPVIVEKLQKIGFLFVTLDLQGYVSGSMNRSI